MPAAEAKATATVDQGRAIDTVTAAFISDPISRWAFRDAQQYLTYFPRLVRIFASGAFDSGTAYLHERSKPLTSAHAGKSVSAGVVSKRGGAIRY